MGYGSNTPGRRLRRPTSATGVRSRIGVSASGCVNSDDARARPADGPNPFAAQNAQFLRQRRQRCASSGHARDTTERPPRPTSAIGRVLETRQREQSVYLALDRLDKKDTLGQGVRQLHEVITGLSQPADFAWFLRVAFDDRRLVSTTKARREQILLLPVVLRQYAMVLGRSNLGHGDASAAVTNAIKSALQNRAFPFLLATLRDAAGSEVEACVARAVSEIVSLSLLPDGAEANSDEDFFEICHLAIKALMDPLVIGSGWDVLVKQRCVTVLGGVIPTILDRVNATEDHARADKFMDNFATLLMQCLRVNSTAQEGLLNCLAQLARRYGPCVAPHLYPLTELCATHLAETPSAAPSYGQRPSSPDGGGRSESPKRRLLTRELALVCCICLKYLARDVVSPGELPALQKEFSPLVESALSRENLDLQRLTRGNDALRQAIAHALRAWTEGPREGRDASDDEFLAGPFRHDRAYSGGAQLQNLARQLAENPVEVRLGPRRRPGSPRGRPARSQSPRRELPAMGRQEQRATRGYNAGGALDRFDEKSSRGSLHGTQQRMPEPLTQDDYLDDPHGASTLLPSDLGDQNFEEDRNIGTSPPEEPHETVRVAGGGPAAAKRLRQRGSEPDAIMAEVRAEAEQRIADARAAADAAVAMAREEAEARIASVRAEAEAMVAAARAEERAEMAQNEAARLREELMQARSSRTDHGRRSHMAAPMESEFQNAHGSDAGAQASGRSARKSDVATSAERNEGVQTSGRMMRQADAATCFECDESTQTVGRHARRAHIATSMDHDEAVQTSRWDPIPPYVAEASTGVEFHSATQTHGIPPQTMEASTGIEQSEATQTVGLPAVTAEAGTGVEFSSATQTNAVGVDVATSMDAVGVSTQTRKHFSGAGRVPPASPDSALALRSKLVDERLYVGSEPGLENEIPSLNDAKRHIAAGRVDAALQTVFQFGNEHTLRAVLRLLDPIETWRRLPEAETRYLARVLARLVCKDPLHKAAGEACPWLDGLLSVPDRSSALAADDLSNLQGALYTLASAQGATGVHAAAVYYKLFHERLA